MQPNWQITKADIICAEDIWGLNLGSLKGKTARAKLSRVIMNTCNVWSYDWTTWRHDAHSWYHVHQWNPICNDNVTGNTLQNCRSYKKEKISTIMIAQKQVIEAYKARRLKTWHILADGKFEHSWKHIENMGIILNITSREEHVP